MTFSISTVNTSTGLGVAKTTKTIAAEHLASLVYTATNAASALAKVDRAIETLSATLQDIGAKTARLTVKESTLRISITNTDATKSRILDTDIASEQLNSTKLQILQQTATAQLAQANVAPQNVLALFQ